MTSGRTPVLFCKHGHEIAVVGRYGNGRCRACERKWRTEWRLSQGKRPRRRTPKVSASRLRVLALSREHAVRAWMRYRHCDEVSARRSMERLWHKELIGIDSADMWCLALGLHLAIVYPELYHDLEETAV